MNIDKKEMQSRLLTEWTHWQKLLGELTVKDQLAIINLTCTTIIGKIKVNGLNKMY